MALCKKGIRDTTEIVLKYVPLDTARKMYRELCGIHADNRVYNNMIESVFEELQRR